MSRLLKERKREIEELKRPLRGKKGGGFSAPAERRGKRKAAPKGSKGEMYPVVAVLSKQGKRV